MQSGGTMLTGRVLITGGAGFLGRGILRRAVRENWPAEFTVYSRDETKQFEAKRKYPDVEFVLGDILEVDRLALVARRYDTIIHAAAIKYIPEGEFNVNECVRVNVDGSRAVLLAAKYAGVKEVVMISTDKAVLPINAYGMTKAIMERLVGEAARLDPDRKYVACRYGNVVGSTGSIIPVFQQMLRDTGVMRITDPNMTRFWISVDDAVDLIERGLQPDVTSGSIVIPTPRASDVGEIGSAVLMVGRGRRLEYNDPSRGTFPFEFVGMRPGEKMHEDLLSESECTRTHSLDDNYYELMPPGNHSDTPAPRLSSETAERIKCGELAKIIEDAATV